MAIPSQRRAGIGLEIKSMAPGFRAIDGLFLYPQPFIVPFLSQTLLDQNRVQKSPDFVDYHAPCQIPLRSRISGAQDGSELGALVIIIIIILILGFFFPSLFDLF